MFVFRFDFVRIYNNQTIHSHCHDDDGKAYEPVLIYLCIDKSRIKPHYIHIDFVRY